MSASGSESEEGVYYRREDYVGVWRRLLIETIDFGVALVLSLGLTVLLLDIFAPALSQEEMAEKPFIWKLLILWSMVWFVYLVILKRTRIRTLGYWIGSARIVDLKGNTPGIGALTIRLAFAAIGPINVIVDLFWMTGDDNRQALRDKFAGTYVINRKAQPAGRGKIVVQSYSFYWNFLFREVLRPS